MKPILITCFALVLSCGEASAGVEYDNCRKEEKALREIEADKCGDFYRLVNPSGCIAAQAALKEYDAGKCWKISGADAIKSRNSLQRAATPMTIAAPLAPTTSGSTPGETSAIERLKAENEQLKAEITRLNAEINRLKSSGK